MAMMFLRICAVLTSLLVLSSCTPVAEEPYQWKLPAGFPQPLVPADNPMSDAKVELGRTIFYDRNLSFNSKLSCADCHQQLHGFAQPTATTMGASGDAIRRNSQVLINVAFNGSLTWAHTGLNTIEQQLLIPMFSEQPVELGITGHEEEILARFNTSHYQQLSQEAFANTQLDFELIVKALASFVRSLVSFDSAFDRYAYQQQDEALNDSEKRGLELFFNERFECFHCHGGFNFTQSSKHEYQQLDLQPFHNIGLYNTDGEGAYPATDQGLIEVTLEARDMGRFRAPTLRNIGVSAPYMHDGSLKTLEEVIDFYIAGGRAEGVSSPIKSVFLQGIDMTPEEKQDLIAFLNSLTDHEFLTNPDFAATK
jgi:cytochrome c peroxidase